MPDPIPEVIVVEDDPSMSQAIERMLAMAGYRTTAFPTAEALLAADAACAADCLVIDVHLPGLSGFELHRRLACSGALPPVIFITGQDTATARNEAEGLGAVAFLAKPFSGRALVRAVGRATSK